MPSRITSQSALRGFLIPAKEINESTLDKVNSTFTQHGGNPGIDFPGSAIDKTQISVTNAQKEDIDFKMSAGGLSGSSNIIYKYDSEASTEYRGWNPPNLITGTSSPLFDKDNTISVSNTSMVTIDSTGKVVLCAMVNKAGTGAFTGRPYIYIYDPLYNTWDSGNPLTVTSGESPTETDVFSTCSLVVDKSNERIFCFIIAGDVTIPTKWSNGYCYFSDDKGVTWEIWSENILPEPSIAVTSGLLSGRFSLKSFILSGNIYLIESLKSNVSPTYKYVIYKSSDYGNTFTVVYDSNNPVGSASLNVTSTNSSLDFFKYLNFVECKTGKILSFAVNTSDNHIYCKKLNSLSVPNENDYEDIISSALVIGYTDITSWVDYDGIVYLLVMKQNESSMFFSKDEGLTWGSMPSIFRTNDTSATGTTTYKNNVVSTCGYSLLLGIITNSTYSSGDFENKLMAFKLGGWSTLTFDPLQNLSSISPKDKRLPFSPSFGSNNQISYAADSMTYFPADIPSNMNGWTSRGAGTESITNGNPYLIHDFSAGASSRYYTYDSGGYNKYVVCYSTFKNVSGGSNTIGRTAIKMQIGQSAGFAYNVQVNLTPTQINLYDNVSSSVLASSTITSGSFYDIMFIGKADSTIPSGLGGRFICYYKKEDEVIWNHIGTPGVDKYQATAGAGTTTKVQWGTGLGGASTTAVSNFKNFNFFIANTDVGWREGNGSWSADIQNGKKTSSYEYPLAEIYYNASNNIYKQQFFKCLSGPSRFGETHTIKRVYDYPIENIMYEREPSPNIYWKSLASVATPSEQTIEFDLTNKTSFKTSSLAVYLENINFKQCIFEGYNISSLVWDTIATMNMYIDFNSISYVRNGDCLIPSSSTFQGARYVYRNELAGSTVLINNLYYREIESNTEGFLGGTSKMAQIKFTPKDTNDIKYTTPTIATSGSFTCFNKKACLVKNTTSNGYSKYRIRIPSQEVVPDSDGLYSFKIGTLLIGSFQPFGQQWSLQSSQTVTPNIESSTNQAGTSSVRKVGELQRSWNITWADGMDQTGLYNNTENYFADDYGNIIGTHRDVGNQLIGIYEDIDSGEIPVVLLSKVSPTMDTQVITDPTTFLYGRMTSPITKEVVSGDEGIDQVIRVSSITIDGIV